MNRMGCIVPGKRAQGEYKLIHHGEHDKETKREGIDLPGKGWSVRNGAGGAITCDNGIRGCVW